MQDKNIIGFNKTYSPVNIQENDALNWQNNLDKKTYELVSKILKMPAVLKSNWIVYGFGDGFIQVPFH